MFSREQLGEKITSLARKGVCVGASSWKYEGWIGQIYSRQRYASGGGFSRQRFEEKCLAEYAEVFKTVGVDATFYQFPEPGQLEKWMKQVPSGFQFGFKVTGNITMKHFPSLPRHGAEAGRSNPDFLNAELFARRFLEPCRPFRAMIGLLVFEFTRFRRQDYARGSAFVEELDAFLGKLPADWNYAVEIRNRNFLQPEYFQALARHHVAHVYNHWTRMPPVNAQMELPGSQTADFVAARFLLTPGRAYEEAVKQFLPYSEIRVVDETGRQAGRTLIARARTLKSRPSFIFVNNRFEGNAPLSMAAMLE